MTAFTIQNLSGRIGASNKMEYQYLNFSLKENSFIVSSEFYKFRVEFSYDEEGTLLLHSYFGPGISLDMIDELEQLVMEEFGEVFDGYEEFSENMVEFDDLNELAKESAQKGEQNAREFHCEADLKILNDSPEEFFATFNIKKYFGTPEEAENSIPGELRKQINEFYKVEYAYCCGYLFCTIHAVQEEYSEILSIPSSCGILIFDVEHIYGIIEFEGFRRAFADVWNRQRGPQAPKLYPTDLNSMYLVKKFTANDAGKITESGWDYFFSNFPSTVTRTYNEFLNK